MRDSKLFDEVVMRFFEPIARRLRLPLSKVHDGAYDIPSPYFIMRVRLDTGHARGLNVILRPAQVGDFDENDPAAPQYGIGCFMQLRGEPLESTFIQVDTNQDFVERARLLAEAAERLAVPYLLGQGTDFQAVQEMVRKKTEEDIARIKDYHFPKNVRKEWL